MNKKSFYLIGVLLLLVLGVSLVFISKRFLIPKKVHYHAGFVVFENNKKLVFSDLKYMYIEPCSLKENTNTSDASIQIEKAHLHDYVGDLVHIERSGAVWKDLFTNIQFPINYSQTTGYINEKKVTNFQQQLIKPFDSLVVFIGDNDRKYLQEGVSKSYIEAQAKKSINCGD